jgi:hypothetical protein
MTTTGDRERLTTADSQRTLTPAFLHMPESNDKGLRKGHVAVRLDPATIARLDALLILYALPGRAATRSDGLRAVILAGLEVEERRAALLVKPGSGQSGGSGGP